MMTTATPPQLVDADIADLARETERFRTALNATKSNIADIDFYPYDTLANFGILSATLTGDNRRLLKLAAGGPVVDVGAADGALAFFLESIGCRDVHIVDNAQTNFNSLRGARALKQALNSAVEIHEIDLDSQFSMPQSEYGLVFFLGLLYHLKNPFYALERLARCSRHIVLSTRIAQYATPLAPTPARSRLQRLATAALNYLAVANAAGQQRIEGLPIAYLLDDYESNNDSTNYWIFTAEGLKRLLRRSGWEVLDFARLGNTFMSEPASAERDERAFCLARSRFL